MAEEVIPDPLTSKTLEEGMTAFKQFQGKAHEFVPKTCPECGYVQEIKDQQFCGNCLLESDKKVILQ